MAQVVVANTRQALGRFTRARLLSQRVKVVGVTGSAGKTTTKEMLAAVLQRRAKVLKTEGNLNTYTGLPMTLAHLEPGDEVFVAEYAMSAVGEIAELARMAPPDIAVVLNVGLAHVGLLGSIEAIAAAKTELVKSLTDGGTAVLNADDERVAAMARATRARVLTFGIEKAADVRAEGLVAHGVAGSDFELHLPGSPLASVRLSVPGSRAVSNALAAAAAGYVLGVPANDIVEALAGMSSLPGRMALRQGRSGSLIIDDTYNSSPAAARAALDVLLSEPGRRHLAVLGDMLELGDAGARELHREVGRGAAGVDLLVAVGEHAPDMAAGALEAGLAWDRMARPPNARGGRDGRWSPTLEGAVVLVKASRAGLGAGSLGWS